MLNEAKQLHCDTRDFCDILLETEPEKKDDHCQKIPIVSEQQLVTSKKLIEFLKHCKQISGGEGECYESKEESIPGNHILHGSILWMWFQE